MNLRGVGSTYVAPALCLMLGTVAYMSPEQVISGICLAQSDPTYFTNTNQPKPEPTNPSFRQRLATGVLTRRRNSGDGANRVPCLINSVFGDGACPERTRSLGDKLLSSSVLRAAHADMCLVVRSEAHEG
jgi:hypothetical protein